MTLEYNHCPNPKCLSRNINESEQYIKCFDCKKTFDKNILNLINEVAPLLVMEENRGTYEKIMQSTNKDDYIKLLKKFREKNKSSCCPYCFEIIDRKSKICQFCGIAIKESQAESNLSI